MAGADSGTIATSSSSVNRVWATIQDPKSSFDQSLDAIRSLSYVDLSNRLQPKGVVANVNALDDAPFLMPRVIVEKCLSTEYSFPCVKITGIGVVTRQGDCIHAVRVSDCNASRKLVQTMQSVLGYKEDIVDRMDKVYKWLGDEKQFVIANYMFEPQNVAEMREAVTADLFNKPFGADIRPHVKSRHLFAHLACDEWLSDEVMNGAVDQFLGEQLEARADTPGFVQQFESICSLYLSVQAESVSERFEQGRLYESSILFPVNVSNQSCTCQQSALIFVCGRLTMLTGVVSSLTVRNRLCTSTTP